LIDILKYDKLTDNPKQKRKATAGDIRRAMAGGTHDISWSPEIHCCQQLLMGKFYIPLRQMCLMMLF